MSSAIEESVQESAAVPNGATRGRLSLLWNVGKATVRQIWAANTVTLQALWDAQKGATLLRLGVGVASTAAPFLGWWGSGMMIDQLASGEAIRFIDLVPGALAFTGSFALMALIPVALSSLERMSDNWTFEHVFGKFTRKLVTFSQENLANPQLAESIKQGKERAVWRMMGMAKSQPMVIRSVGMLLITAVLVAIKAPLLLLVLLAFGLPTVILELRHARKRSDLEERLAPQWGALWGDLYSLMVAPALAMLHQFGAALWFAHRYRVGLRNASAAECSLEHKAARGRCLAALAVGVGLAICLAILLDLTRKGELSVGEFVLVMSAISGLGAGLADFASLLGQQWSQSRSIADFTALLAHKASQPVTHRYQPLCVEYSGVPEAEGATSLPMGIPSSSPAALTFDSVWYRYPSADAQQFAVRGLSFTVPAGSVVAVVGPNGAGKSSMMALLSRQLPVTTGKILINGQPIDQMSEREFCQQVVMMPQLLRHFNLTVRELLNLGRSMSPERASDAVLWSELERVGAAEFVRTWKHGLDTQLGLDRREAVEPSGGQLQRLLLAAVVVANRGLIVLDEPVSMVDPEAAKRFWDAVFAETTDRTVLFSTHHLGAVRRADLILFIEGGRVAAHGTHDQLIVSSERYRKLFEAQASEYR